MLNLSRRSILLSGSALMASGFTFVGAAYASNHFETELVQEIPELSITDSMFSEIPPKIIRLPS